MITSTKPPGDEPECLKKWRKPPQLYKPTGYLGFNLVRFKNMEEDFKKEVDVLILWDLFKSAERFLKDSDAKLNFPFRYEIEEQKREVIHKKLFPTYSLDYIESLIIKYDRFSEDGSIHLLSAFLFLKMGTVKRAIELPLKKKIYNDPTVYFRVVKKIPLAKNQDYLLCSLPDERINYLHASEELSIDLTANSRKIILRQIKAGIKSIEEDVKKLPLYKKSDSTHYEYLCNSGKQLLERYKLFALPTQYYGNTYNEFKNVISSSTIINFKIDYLPTGINGTINIFCFYYLQTYYVNRIFQKIFSRDLIHSGNHYVTNCENLTADKLLRFSNALKGLNFIDEDATIFSVLALFRKTYGHERTLILNWKSTLRNFAVVLLLLEEDTILSRYGHIEPNIANRTILLKGKEINIKSLTQTISSTKIESEHDQDLVFLDGKEINRAEIKRIISSILIL